MRVIWKNWFFWSVNVRGLRNREQYLMIFPMKFFGSLATNLGSQVVKSKFTFRDTWDSYFILISWFIPRIDIMIRKRERVKTICVAIFLWMHPRLHPKLRTHEINLTFQSISSLCISFLISAHSQFSYFSFLVFFFFMLHSEVSFLFDQANWTGVKVHTKKAVLDEEVLLEIIVLCESNCLGARN